MPLVNLWENPMFLFHQAPQEFVGNEIFPLNRLKRASPVLYKRYSAKYSNRRLVAETHIPPLNCNWGDVAFFTRIHPCTWRRVFNTVGISVGELRFFAINISDLVQKNLCVLEYDAFGKGYFTTFTKSALPRYEVIPDNAVTYFQKCAQEGKIPYWHHLVPQILYKGIVDVRDAPIITV